MVNDFLKKYVRLIICFICFALSTALLQAQTDPALQWVKGIGNVEPSSPTTMNFVTSVIKLDSLGNRYVAGSFTGIADFDPGADNVNLTSAGGTDIFIAKYDSLGRYVWAKRVGGGQSDKANDLVLDKNGNVYIIGDYRSTVDFDPGADSVNLTSLANTDIFLAKYDKDGNYLWAKSFGGDYYDYGNSLALDSSNNVIITGSFQAIVDFDPGPDTAYLKRAAFDDVFFAKYDSNGNYLFAKSLVGTNNETATSVAIDASGNIFLTGALKDIIDLDPGIDSANIIAIGLKDIFIAKYDALGNYIWGKRIGGSSDDIPQKLVLDAKANIFLTGYFQNTVDFDAGSGTVNLISAGAAEIFITKYDSAGNYQWAKSMGGSSDDISKSLALDTSGNILITGVFKGTSDFDPGASAANLINTTDVYTALVNYDAFLAKYDSLGNYLWAFKMGNAKDNEGSSVAVNANGNVVVFGYFSGIVDFDPGTSTANLIGAVHSSKNAFIASYSSAGNYIGASVLGRYSISNNVNSSVIIKDAAGNIYETGSFTGMVDFDPGAGTANLSNGALLSDIFIAKYDSSGNYLWAKSIGGDATDNAYAIKLSNKGNILITGAFSGTVDFDPGNDVQNLSSAGSSDIFIAKYNGDGNYIWAKKIGKTSADQGNALLVDENENVFVTGSFQSTTVDFDPGAGTASLSSAGSTDIFLAKYDSLGVYKWAKKMGGTGGDVGTSLMLDSKKNILVTGTFASTVDFDPGAGTVNLVSAGFVDIFLAKYDSLGNYIWAKNMGGSTTDKSLSLIVDSFGSSYTTGYFTGTVDFDASSNIANLTSAGINSNDIFLTKYDSSGNYLWAKSIGSSGDDQGYALALDSSGNLLVTGYFSNTADFNPGIDSAKLSSVDGLDVFFAKYDSAGNYIYAKAMGGAGNDVGSSLALNNRGNVLLAGTFSNTVDFDPGDGITNLTSVSGNQYGFIAEYGTAVSFVFGLNKFGQQTSTFSEFINKNGAVGLSGIRSTGENIAYAPTLAATTAVTDITSTSASCGGNVGSDNGSSVTTRGVCWSLTTRPTTANSKTTDGNGIGTFTSAISGLASGTTYYVRSYATNSVGTTYGQEVSFTTL